jgi:hypothetical protein
MKMVAKRIVILISISSVLIGCLLIVFQLNVIPKDLSAFTAVLINFWPITLIIAGAIFLRDSFLRQQYLRHHAAVEKTLAITYPFRPREVSLEILFSFGNLVVNATDGESELLRCEQVGPMPDPVIEQTAVGNTSHVKIHKPKPYLSPHFRVRTVWSLSLARRIPHNLSLSIHETDLTLDMRELRVEKLSLKTNSGRHSLYFPESDEKFEGDIYSSSDRLELIVPDESFLRLNLLNPFCRVDFPQGDFEKKEDGSIISNERKSEFGLIELSIDGPLKQLVLDIA